jgi:hypothetical protein
MHELDEPNFFDAEDVDVHVSPKRHLFSNGLHGVISQKLEPFKLQDRSISLVAESPRADNKISLSQVGNSPTLMHRAKSPSSCQNEGTQCN